MHNRRNRWIRRRFSPRLMARCLIPSASSQLIRSCWQAAEVEHSRRTSIASRSNQAVNRLHGSTQGTFTSCVPWSGHFTQSTSAMTMVLNWQLSRCRHRRFSSQCLCIRRPHSGQPYSVSAQTTSISIVDSSFFSATDRTDQGACNPSICS